MCKAWDEQEEWGRMKGLSQGRSEGKIEGKAEDVRNIMDSLKITALEAMDILKITKEDQPKYLEMLKG